MKRVSRRASVRLAACLAGGLLAAASALSAEQSATGAERLDLELIRRNWKGDFDKMVERNMIRALVVYSKTFYFLDGATQRGASYDALRAFEDRVNKQLGRKVHRVHVVFIPVSRDELLPEIGRAHV